MKIVLPKGGLPCPGIVKWLDAAVRLDEDEELENLQDVDHAGQEMLTYGLVVKVGRTNVLIATDTSSGEPRTFRGIQRIPRKLLLAQPIWLGPLDCSMEKEMSG